MFSRLLFLVVIAQMGGCSPDQANRATDSSDRVVNGEARRLAGLLRHSDPDRCDLQFKIHFPRPWVSEYVKGHQESSDNGLSISIHQPGQIEEFVNALAKSSRESGIAVDPAGVHIGEVRDALIFSKRGREIARFRFIYEQIEPEWGKPLAQLIKPVYERATRPYMPSR